MTGLETERWTAVSGSSRHAERVRDAVQTAQRAEDRIIVGNWANPEFLKDEVYDTVIADYLLGALEGFAPYFQPYLFTRLRPLVQKTLYVTGLEPYVPTARPETKAGRIVWDIGRFRDACVLLAGGMPYREYPSQWVGDQLQRAGFTVQHLKRFDISYKALFVNAQIDIALSGLDELPDRTLAESLKARGEALRTEALDMIRTEGALRACRNYVFSAKPL